MSKNDPDYGDLPSSQGDWENQQARSGRNANCIRYAVGIVAILLSLGSWDTMNEVINSLQEQYPKPYQVTWVLHNGYLVFLIFFIPILFLVQCLRQAHPPSITFKHFLWASLFNFMLFASDYMWVLALGNAAVIPSLTSAIFNTCGVWVYILALIFLKEIVDLRKIISLVVGLMGVGFILASALVGPNGPDDSDDFNYTECTANYTVEYNASSGDYDFCFEPYVNITDLDKAKDGFLGYSVMVGCAVLFACYEVVFSRWEKKHEQEMISQNPTREHGDSCATVLDTLITVALMGVSNLVFMWIPMIILHYSGWEHFSVPLFRYEGTDHCCWNLVSWQMILNAGLGAIYTSSFLVAVAMIGPFIAAVGLILIIPVGFITDYFLGNWNPSTEEPIVLAFQITGCGLIVIGFLLLQWASKVHGKKRCVRGNAAKKCECILW